MIRTPRALASFALGLSGLVAAWPALALDGTCSQPQYATEEPLTLVLDDKVELTADQIDLDKAGLSTLAGAVKLRQGEKEFSAEALDYDDQTRRVTVKSESLFRNPQLIIKSQQAEFDLDMESGSFLGADFVLPSRAARGTSDRITVFQSGHADFKVTSYTTCSPDSDAWYLTASDIRLDHDEGLGTARNAVLSLAKVPVLYLPYFQFPIDDRRRSGLLFPTVGESSKTGFDMRWPVYLNLAPNYDATITPRLMTDRGLQFGSDFRYLLGRGEGHAKYEYLDDREFGQDRSYVQLEHDGLLNQRLGLEIDYNEVSDREYFEDLGGTFELSSITHIERSARLTYQAPAAYTVQALVQNFQPIASQLQSLDDPYKRLPQIRLDALTKNALYDTRAGFAGEFVNFAREASVEGMRVDLQPYLRYLHEQQAWYFTSQADLHYTAYNLKDNEAGQPQKPERTLPVLSAEGGLRFERITGSGAIQTLEPRGFALYVPYENQDELPLFDTGEPDFDFVQLFARNRYSGNDRISDAQHVAGALTTRMIDPDTGLARWSASFGQLYRLDQPQVELPDEPAPQSGATEFIAQIEYQIAPRWLGLIATQWSPRESQFDRSNFTLRYSDPERGQRFDIAYRYRRDILEQADVSLSLPVTGSWRIAARSRYSLADNQSLESLAGVEYETCCWAVRGSWRRYIASTDGDYNSGVYFQLELKGLTRIGSGFSNLLPTEDDDSDVF